MKYSIKSFSDIANIVSLPESIDKVLYGLTMYNIEKLSTIGLGFCRYAKATGRTSLQNLVRRSHPKNKNMGNKRITVSVSPSSKPDKLSKVLNNNPLIKVNKCVPYSEPKTIYLVGYASKKVSSHLAEKWDRKTYNL